jgi:undecaprenyl diphosphate synthase
MNLKNLPCHVGIIMDGNGRWAKSKGMPHIFGHRQGAEVVKEIVDAAIGFSIPYITLYAFSAENWQRPNEEVKGLINLLRWYLQKNIQELHDKGVRLKIIGERTKFENDIISLFEQVEEKTKDNKSVTLVLALSYGGRQEILRAAQLIAQKVKQGILDAEGISIEDFQAHLETAGIPDPDLIIRTSGEQRLSNFLLWQAAYSELVFNDVLWPDFNKDTFIEAIQIYSTRERRYGKKSL